MKIWHRSLNRGTDRAARLVNTNAGNSDGISAAQSVHHRVGVVDADGGFRPCAFASTGSFELTSW